jgi:excisionase family DNA binding protein
LGDRDLIDEDELMDIRRAAEFLGVSATSLRRWTNAGLLASLRIGGRRERRFRRGDLVAFMEHRPIAAAMVDGARESRAADDVMIEGLPVPLGSHLCGLYASDVGRASLAAGFLADGLRRGSVCLLVGPPDTRDGILDQLRARGQSIEGDLDDGMLEVADYAGTAQKQYEYFEQRFAAATRAGARSFRVVGDLLGFSSAADSRVVVEYETGYEHRIARRFPVVTLCQYDVRAFSGAAVLNALKGHRDSLRYPAERWMA